MFDGLVAVGADGRIAAVTRAGEAGHERAMAEAGENGTLDMLPGGATCLPGFVDCHVHAPQYPQAGLALDRPLEEWLHAYTFPLEARYADVAFARHVYAPLVDDMLAGGTTAALIFATVHVPATLALVDICAAKGLRATVGKVGMDRDCPADCRDGSVTAMIEGTRAVIEHAGANGAGLVRGAVTPRFVPSCTDGALEALGALAAETGAVVQSHVSESAWQHGHAIERFGRRDAEVLDGFGLLGPRSVMAHGTHLTDGDLALFAERGAAVAHCPLSNTFFGDATFPLARALAKAVMVGLGTDISGGPDLSMLSAQRHAVAASRMRESGTLARGDGEAGARIDWRIAFHLATVGGAKALDLSVGAFEPGMHLDALVVEPHPLGTLRRLDVRGAEDELARILVTASRPDIATTYVGGVRRVALPG